MEDFHNNQIETMMNVIEELKLNEYVKNFNEKNGALWSSDPTIKELFNAVIKKDDNHSGASLAICFRKCQKKLKEMNNIAKIPRPTLKSVESEFY